jgi:hypothetical protein
MNSSARFDLTLERSLLMTRTALIITALALAGCSSGPVYRGAPPAGMTDRQYECKLLGKDCSMVTERSTVSRNDPGGAAGPF